MKDKLRVVLLVLLTVCATVCLAAAAACSSKSANYINPEDDGSVTGSSYYSVTVMSAGALPLSGIKVELSEDGEIVRTARTNSNGTARFTVDEGTYDVEISDLPAGYALDEDASYQLTPEQKTAEIVITSSVISGTAPSSTVYSVGDIMYDFTIKDVDGTTHTLSEILKEKKAVVLNFFYTTCSPCIAEFPYMQAAYSDYSDELTLLALDNQDTSAQIIDFRTSMESKGTNDVTEYTVSFCRDNIGMHSFFNVQSWPTTVLIDRYGMIIYIDSGSIPYESSWRALFAQLIADDYKQVISEEESSSAAEYAKPTVEDDDYTEIAEAINDPTSYGYYERETNDDAEYSWPFKIGTEDVDGAEAGEYIYASNVGVEYSFSIIYMRDVTLGDGEMLTIEYNIYTDDDEDIIYILYDDYESIAELSGDSNGWQTLRLHISGRSETFSISICYLRTSAGTYDNEHVWFKNVSTGSLDDLTETEDIRYNAAYKDSSAANTNGLSYETVVLNSEDGYYHVGSESGPILYTTIKSATPWSKMHTGSSTILWESSQYYYPASLYWINLIDFQDSDNDDSVTYILNGKDYSSLIINTYYAETYSDNGCVPVTEDIAQMIKDFCTHYANKISGEKYDETMNEWLEMCFYFIHHAVEGSEHEDGFCSMTDDPTVGMSTSNPVKIEEGTDIEVDIYREIAIPAYAYMYYEFTAQHTGVYLICSNAGQLTAKEQAKADNGEDVVAASATLDPKMFLFDSNGNQIAFDDDYFLWDALGSGDDVSGGYPYGSSANFYNYVYLVEGETYCIGITLGSLITGTFTIDISYTGLDSVTKLVLASNFDLIGGWVAGYDDDGNVDYSVTVYSISMDDWGLGSEDSYYHAYSAIYDSKGNVTGYDDLGVIYVDFIHNLPIYSDNVTLYDLIMNGYFNFTSSGKGDYTDYIYNTYYLKAIANEGELYGLIEADSTLVELLCMALQLTIDGDVSDAFTNNYWLCFCCYYLTVDADNITMYNDYVS